MRFEHLACLVEPTPLQQLDENQLSELQAALSRLGYPVGDIDGLLGPRTRNAWAEFKTDVFEGNPELVGRESLAALRQKLDGLADAGVCDFGSKEGTIEAIRRECIAQDIGLPAQVAYVLATTQWETAQTFKPVREAFWCDDEWRRCNFRYYPYYGRGYVQLTWRNNYAKYGQLLGLDLVDNPDLAMEPGAALFILVHGFKTGAFTGRRIADYIDADRCDFISARRCINGSDRAHEIARLAEKFLQISDPCEPSPAPPVARAAPAGNC